MEGLKSSSLLQVSYNSVLIDSNRQTDLYLLLEIDTEGGSRQILVLDHPVSSRIVYIFHI